VQIAIEAQAGFAQVIAPHFHVTPTHMLAQTSAEGFDKGFLGGETRRIAGIGGVLCTAIGLLNIGVQALDQACPRARNGALHALNLDQVNTNTVDHRSALAACSFSGAQYKTLESLYQPVLGIAAG